MSNQYVAYQNIATGEAFFNPVGFSTLAVGEEVYGARVLAVGDLAAVQAVVAQANAKLPVITFQDLLGE